MDKFVKQVTKSIENVKKSMESLIGTAKKKVDSKQKELKSAASKSAKMSPMPMKFPYTFSAKLGQFPWKFYVTKNWIFKYYFVGVLLSAPVFHKINNLVNSEGNKKKWAEVLAKDEEEMAHHH